MPERTVDDCVILDNCDIGRRSKLKRVILDKNVRIPEDAEIGFDLEHDRLFHHVTESGIVVMGTQTPVPISAICWFERRSMDEAVFDLDFGRTGIAAIFVLLVFGIVGLPVPDETLLTFTRLSGVQGQADADARVRWRPFAAAPAASRSATVLGRTFGLALIHRYGKYVAFTEEHMQKAHDWFERVGHWGLTFGYFVPGIRHLTRLRGGDE